MFYYKIPTRIHLVFIYIALTKFIMTLKKLVVPSKFLLKLFKRCLKTALGFIATNTNPQSRSSKYNWWFSVILQCLQAFEVL